MKFPIISLCLIVLCCVTVIAAEKTKQIVMEADALEGHSMIAGGAAMQFGPGQEPGTFVFLSSEFEIGDKAVQGAPYSAEAVTERIQILSDGNRIVNRNSANIYRDSQGRTRRDFEMNSIGNWVSETAAPRLSFIVDPVAKTHYVLNHKEQSARKMPVPEEKILKHKKPSPGPTPSPTVPEEEDRDVFTMALPAPPGNQQEHVVHFLGAKGQTKTESLGNQTFEGIVAQGTRNITTIPANQIGNELPIQIISEKWYSPELKVTIMTQSVDPRFGETTYRLTNIRRNEPDVSLFQVPEGYKIQDEPFPGKMIIRKKVVEKTPGAKNKQ